MDRKRYRGQDYSDQDKALMYRWMHPQLQLDMVPEAALVVVCEHQSDEC